MGTQIASNFQAATRLRSRHMQTIWPSVFRQRHQFIPEWERVELDDGDFIDLAWHRRPDSDSPLVLLIHGLGGSIDSHYAGNMMAALYAGGFSSVLLHLRGQGRELNRLPQSYHSGKTEDLRLILGHLQQTQRLPQAAVGVSLGANLLLKYLGEEGAGSLLQQAVAVSVPFQLKVCSLCLERGFAKYYGQYLLSHLKAVYHKKFSTMPSPLSVNMREIKTLWQFDDAVTAPLHGFAGADDYYRQCSSGQFLMHITTPTLIIHAQDDPFMTPEIVPSAAQVSASVQLEITSQGGHVGFVEGKVGRLHYWLEARVVQHLQEALSVVQKGVSHRTPQPLGGGRLLL